LGAFLIGDLVLVPHNYRKLTISQLATAILTNPSEDSGTAIRLSDTQIRSREDFYIDANADERNVLLPGEASESEDDHDSVDEAKLNKERRKVLGNSAAQASRMDVNSISNKNGYHIVNGGDAGDRADADAQNGNDLSAKAGIILVGDPDFLSSLVNYSYMIVGHSKYLHRHPSIPCHWFFLSYIRYL
jgi:hypothetical protein